MTKDEIIQMAREAGILEPIDLLESNQWRQDTIRELERFADLVAEKEREACAKVCDDWAKTSYLSEAKSCAKLIRTRVNK